MELAKRDYCYGYCGWTWGRWVLLAFVVLVIVFVLLGALRKNKQRGQQGNQPIIGTAWFTPPSYYASNAQQGRTQQPMYEPPQQPYVPPYTPEAGEQDAGYYDQQGVYHPKRPLVPDNTSASFPPGASTTASYAGASYAGATTAYGARSGSTSGGSATNDYYRDVQPAHLRR